MRSIAALLYPHALATSITLPMEIMRAAGQMASVHDRSAPGVEFRLAGPDRRQIKLSSGIVLKPDIAYDELTSLDLLLLPAIWRNPMPTVNQLQSFLPRLRQYADAGTRICSVGTGSFLLAEAGVLDTRSATTHWNYLQTFARRYPAVNLQAHHLITQSDNIYCAGSVNSIADLMVHIVEQWYGGHIARGIENQFSPEIRRSFQEAAYQDAAGTSHRDEVVAEAQQWLQQHLASPLTIAALAQRLQLTPRTLNRRFKRATGMTPMGYLQSLRIASARDLLKHSNLAVGDIAWQVGLQDVSYFAQLFKRHSGMSPLRYRAAVRGKLFDPEVAEHG